MTSFDYLFKKAERVRNAGRYDMVSDSAPPTNTELDGFESRISDIPLNSRHPKTPLRSIDASVSSAEEHFNEFVINLDSYAEMSVTAYTQIMTGNRRLTDPVPPEAKSFADRILSFYREMRKSRYYIEKDLSRYVRQNAHIKRETVEEVLLPSYSAGGMKYIFARSRLSEVQFGMKLLEDDLRHLKIDGKGHISFDRPALRVAPFFYLPPEGIQRKEEKNRQRYEHRRSSSSPPDDNGDYSLPTAVHLMTELSAFVVADVPQLLAAHLLDLTHTKHNKDIPDLTPIDDVSMFPTYSLELVLGLESVTKSVEEKALQHLGFEKVDDSALQDLDAAKKHFLRSMGMGLFEKLESWTEGQFFEDFVKNYTQSCARLPVKKTMDLMSEQFDQNRIAPPLFRS
jgi:hypothetical protein